MIKSLKNKGFDRIRKLAAAGSLGVMGMLGGAPSGRAAPSTLSFSLTTGGVQWNSIDNDFGTHSFHSATILNCTTTTVCQTSTTGNAFGIGDASLTGPSRDDAFDTAFGMSVDGAVFVAPGGIVDLTGNTVTAGPVTLSGLNTEIRYEFFSARPLVRALYSFTNPTGAAISTVVVVGGEYGSDDSAIVQATGSGDAVIDPSDSWYITSDGPPSSSNGPDPTITISRFTPGGAVVPVTLNAPGSGSNDYFSEQYSFTVPAGATRRLILFGELNDLLPTATGDAPDFSTTASMQAAGLFANLSAAEIADVVNISAPVVAAPPATPVPTLSAWTLTSLAGLLGLFGFAALRRRRQA